MTVTETFFSLTVRDMDRAIAFYTHTFGATVSFATPVWTSIHVAGVRLGLFHDPRHAPARVGLYFAVADLAAGCAEVVRAGGAIAVPPNEVAPGVHTADVTDPEGNTFTLRG